MKTTIAWGPLAVVVVGCARTVIAPPDLPPADADVIQFRLAYEKPEGDAVPMNPRGDAVVYYVDRKVELNAADLAAAKLRRGADGRAVIRLDFTKAGSRKQGALTEANLNKRLALVVDGELLAAPIIRERIEGAGELAGQWSRDEARQMVERINAGIAKAKKGKGE